MEDDIITKEQYAPCVSVFVRASQLNIGRELAVLVDGGFDDLAKELISTIKGEEYNPVGGIWALKIAEAILGEARHLPPRTANGMTLEQSALTCTNLKSSHPPAESIHSLSDVPVPVPNPDIQSLSSENGFTEETEPSLHKAPVAGDQSSAVQNVQTVKQPAVVPLPKPTSPPRNALPPSSSPAPMVTTPNVAAVASSPTPTQDPPVKSAAPVLVTRCSKPTDRFRVAYAPVQLMQPSKADDDEDNWSDEESGPERTCEEVDVHQLISHTVGNFRNAVDNLSSDSRMQAASRRQEYGGKSDGTVGRF